MHVPHGNYTVKLQSLSGPACSALATKDQCHPLTSSLRPKFMPSCHTLAFCLCAQLHCSNVVWLLLLATEEQRTSSWLWCSSANLATRYKSQDWQRSCGSANEEHTISCGLAATCVFQNHTSLCGNPVQATGKSQRVKLYLLHAKAPLWHAECLCKQAPCQSSSANCVPMSASKFRANFAKATLVPTKSQQFPCQFGRSNSRANVCAAQFRQVTRNRSHSPVWGRSPCCYT